MSTPILEKSAGIGVNDDDVVFEIASNAEHYDTWQIGSTDGSMDVYVSGDGTTYLSAAVALIDLGSTTPSVAVVATTAGGHYGIRGRWKKIKALQVGATAVAGAYLIGYES